MTNSESARKQVCAFQRWLVCVCVCMTSLAVILVAELDLRTKFGVGVVGGAFQVSCNGEVTNHRARSLAPLGQLQLQET